MSDALGDFFLQRDWDLLTRASQWMVRHDADNPDLVRFSLLASDGERYLVRCDCTKYPDEPPGVVFVNDQGAKDDPTAWPDGNPEFGQIVKPPPNCFLCTSLTREGLAHHPEWKQDARKNSWNGNKHTLMDIFNLVQRLLNSSNYKGRRKS